MPIFKCSKCGCAENTALGNYWWNVQREGKPPLCSECDTGTWHGKFPKRDAKEAGYMLGADGFLYKPEEMEGPNGFKHTTIVGEP